MPMGRPDKTHATEESTRQLTLSAIMLTVATTAVLVWQWLTRTEPIPVIYFFGSEPDTELSPGSLLPLTLVVLAFTVGTLLPVFVPAFGRFPVLVTKKNAEPLYRDSERLHAWITVLIQATVALTAATLLVAETVWLMTIIGGVLLIAIVWFSGFASMTKREFERQEIGR